MITWVNNDDWQGLVSNKFRDFINLMVNSDLKKKNKIDGRYIDESWRIHITTVEPYITHYINNWYFVMVQMVKGKYAVSLWDNISLKRVKLIPVRSAEEARVTAYKIMEQVTDCCLEENMQKKEVNDLFEHVKLRAMKDLKRLLNRRMKAKSEKEVIKIDRDIRIIIDWFETIKRKKQAERFIREYLNLKEDKEMMYTFDEYSNDAKRTMNEHLSAYDTVQHAVFEICSEAGEIAGLYQKTFQGHKLDGENLVLEIGDVLWGLNELCVANGFTLEDCAKKNIEKLKQRYPNGFDPRRSMDRTEEGEDNG